MNSNSLQHGDQAAIWNKVSESYNESDYWMSQDNWANLSALLEHIGDPKGKRIIEVGSGSALTSRAIAERGAEISLLDLSPESLRTAVNGFTRAGLKEPDCHLANALDNKLPDHQFDIAWNGGVIEHFVDEGKKMLIKEMMRIVKPGGRVIILVPNAWCLPFQMVQAWQKWRGTWGYGFEDDMSPRRLARMAQDLKIKDFETYAFNPLSGWHWLPRMRGVIRLLGFDKPENYRRRTPMGNVSVLVIKK